ncbi:hypothetical protein EFT57_10160 [Lacticaseibacillus paracasei]|nr:hypothetical protein [Lacticaseibacillus paracasei]
MNFFCHDGGPPYFSSTDAVMAFAERMLGGGCLRWLGKWVWAGSRSQKSRPLTISDQGATLRVTTLIRTGFDANASTVPILIPGMVTGAPVSVA